MRLLVTGGAGFIGSHFVRHALARWPDAAVVVLDKLTYAGNLENLSTVREDPRLTFVRGDICSPATVAEVMQQCTHVVNFAAETHVDRSILDAGAFVRTDVEGTRVLLEAARRNDALQRYLQISTDEVYGDIPAGERAGEDAPLRPRSPYAASKAAGDLMALAYSATYGLPVLLTRGSNTYGPNQFPEKLIPLFITNALEGLLLPLYGDGLQVRDWIFVDDHCTAIVQVLERGEAGTIYNIGTGTERANRDVAADILEAIGPTRSSIRHVPDRPGHDRRYALRLHRIAGLGWEPTTSLEHGLATTVAWYRDNRDWWRPLKSGDFADYYREQYGRRLEESTP